MLDALDSAPEIAGLPGVEILHPYKDIIPSKPFEFIKKEELVESAPGLIEHYGELEVLSPYALVFLETFHEIRKMDGFRSLVGDLNQNRDFLGSGNLTTEELKVTKTILKVLAYREEFVKKNSSPPKIVNQMPKEDPAIVIFAEELAEHMGGSIQASGTEKFGNYDTYVENLISYRYQELHHQTRKYSGFESATPTLYDTTRAFVEADAGQAQNGGKEIETQEAAEEMLAREQKLSIEITGYSNDNTDPTPFEAARASQSRKFVDNCILGRLPKSELKSPTELPTIVILRGVGQDEKLWQDRINFYRKKDVKVRFIDYPPFDKEMTFEKQAEKVYEELSTGWDKKSLFAIEAHSWGGLIAPYLLKNHPEMFSHAIITGAPTRSNLEEFSVSTKALVAGLDWALKHESLAWNIIQKIHGMDFFRKMGREGFPEAFRIYKAHIGEKGQSQWDEVIKSGSWIIPKFLMYGDHDSMVVKIAGMGAADEYSGATLVRNPNGGHHAIGNDEDALEVHCRLYTQAQKRRRAIIN